MVGGTQVDRAFDVVFGLTFVALTLGVFLTDDRQSFEAGGFAKESTTKNAFGPPFDRR